MLKESNILLNNIKKFRFLNEEVSDNKIVDAIQNHEYIYIYYTGDESNASGYRTVRPYVIGTTKKGDKVLRAWQDKGKSDSYQGKTNRRRPSHEYWSDNDGKVVPGWRLFRVDRIGSLYPTGKEFNDSNGVVLIPPKYREGADDQMVSIIAYVSKTPQKLPTSNIDNITKRGADRRKVSDFDAQAKKWKDFYDADKAEKDITANDVQKLYDIVRKVYKKSPSNYVVFINDKNNLDLKYFKNKDEIPDKLQLGRLTNLYDKFVNKSDDVETKMKNFVDKSLDKLKRGENLK